MINTILDKVQEADLILIGIGTDFAGNNKKEDVKRAYNKLKDMVGSKSYFVVTLNTDDYIYESSLDKERIVAPCGSDAAGNVVTNENYDESIYLPQWETYTRWLQNTLNKKLCILELGVGFQYPSVIRWPFEKTAYFNQKSNFIRVHEKLAQLTPEIKERSISISQNPVHVLIGEEIY